MSHKRNVRAWHQQMGFRASFEQSWMNLAMLGTQVLRWLDEQVYWAF